MMPVEDIHIEVPSSAFTETRVATLLGHLESEKIGEGRAHELVEALLSEAATTIAEEYLDAMAAVLHRIESFRTELRERSLELVERLSQGTPPDKLPARLQAAEFRSLFTSLEIELAKLQRPQDFTGLERWEVELDLSTEGLLEEPLTEFEPPPRVVRGKIEGVRVPRRRGQAAMFDISQLRRRPGETVLQAVARARRVMGRSINETPLRDAWAAARERVLAGRTVESLGKDGALEAYKACQARFWIEVRRDPSAMAFLKDVGMVLEGDRGAPILDVTDPEVPVEQVRISLDHSVEKTVDWTLALDGDNLVFEFHAPNSYRESVQRRLKIGRYAER